MKLAIMQPYLFPYIGYFQLINAVDKFVLLDDVNFINRGWINRNRLLINNKEHLFSIPIKKISQNKLIIDCELSDESWKKKFLKTIEMNYKKAFAFNEIFPLIKSIVDFDETNLSKFICHQIQAISDYLQIKTSIIQSSSVYQTGHLKAQDKIIAICKQENASHYINPIGGIELYEQQKFSRENIQLSFLKTNEIVYPQNTCNFIPLLSIIDVLMFNGQNTTDLLKRYELESPL